MSFGGDNQAWDWQDEEFRLDADSPLAISRSLWDELTQSEEDSRNLFETTPIKGYGESECPASSGDSQGSMQHGNRASPHMKRRRMLQFAAPDSENASIGDQQMAPTFASFEDCRNSLMDDDADLQISDPVSSASFWFSRNEETHSSVSESFDQSSESWMARCFNDGEMPSNSDDKNAVAGFDDQIDVSEFCTLQAPDMDTEMWQEPASPAPKTVPPSAKTNGTRLATPVAYPFALIKPCGVQGDVTLNDINRRISGQSSRLTHARDNMPTQPVSTSAFSGKAVVALTKIHTEGKGSITIMRTKG